MVHSWAPGSESPRRNWRVSYETPIGANGHALRRVKSTPNVCEQLAPVHAGVNL